jgi:hypothetical protein
MGQDIFSEKAIAIELSDLVAKCTCHKAMRKLIADELHEDAVFTEEERDRAIVSKSNAIGEITNKINDLIDDEGYCSEEAIASLIVGVVCSHGGIKLNELPPFSMRMFKNNRISGYDVDLDTLYVMFESQDMFETVMTSEGRKVAKELQIDHITETEWTVHSY